MHLKMSTQIVYTITVYITQQLQPHYKSLTTLLRILLEPLQHDASSIPYVTIYYIYVANMTSCYYN